MRWIVLFLLALAACGPTDDKEPPLPDGSCCRCDAKPPPKPKLDGGWPWRLDGLEEDR